MKETLRAKFLTFLEKDARIKDAAQCEWWKSRLVCPPRKRFYFDPIRALAGGSFLFRLTCLAWLH